MDWTQITAAAAAGAGGVYGWRKLRPDQEAGKVQSEAIAVDTLRDVILELRNELKRVRGKLILAEGVIEKLTGERLPDGLLRD